MAGEKMGNIGELQSQQVQSLQDNNQLLKWVMDPSQQLLRFEMRLRGKRFDDQKKAFVQIEGEEPLLNEKGISSVITTLSPFVDVTTSQANLNDVDISNMGRINMKSFIVDMGVHFKDYGLDQAKIRSICLLVASQMKLMLSMAKDGTGNEKIMRILKVQETQLQQLASQAAYSQRVFR